MEGARMREFRAAAGVNARFLFVRLLALAMRICPARRLLGDTVGFLFGLKLWATQRREWAAILRFARATRAATPGWLYLLRYYVRKGTDWFWEDMYYELGPRLGRHVRLDGEDLVRAAMAGGKGAILLGAHHGPSISGQLLTHAGVDLKVLAAPSVRDQWRRLLRLGHPRLVSNKCRFLAHSENVLCSEHGEREVVRQIRCGQAVMTHLDIALGGKGVVCPFFGVSVRLHYFPFKLALRHGATVFFVSSAARCQGVYTVRCVPAPAFTTPEQGVERYVEFFEREILADPFAWKRLPNFFGLCAPARQP